MVPYPVDSSFFVVVTANILKRKTRRMEQIAQVPPNDVSPIDFTVKSIAIVCAGFLLILLLKLSVNTTTEKTSYYL